MKNRVKEILNARGFKSVQLTDETLEKLFPNYPFQCRFFKIWHNDDQPTADELEAFRQWLGLDTINELITYNTD